MAPGKSESKLPACRAVGFRACVSEPRGGWGACRGVDGGRAQSPFSRHAAPPTRSTDSLGLSFPIWKGKEILAALQGLYERLLTPM